MKNISVLLLAGLLATPLMGCKNENNSVSIDNRSKYKVELHNFRNYIVDITASIGKSNKSPYVIEYTYKVILKADYKVHTELTVVSHLIVSASGEGALTGSYVTLNLKDGENYASLNGEVSLLKDADEYENIYPSLSLESIFGFVYQIY